MEMSDEFGDILLRVESQTMHACVQLDVNGEVSDTFAFGSVDEGVQETETVNLRFQMVLKECVETGELRVHDHNIRGDAGATQFHTLVGHCHGEVIHAVVL